MKQEQPIKYPVGIQSFAEIRQGNYLYVDKTALIEELKKGKYYFLSRPRRFGKSLLLSTLEAYYQGRRDLFRGLALDSLTEDWEPRPVLHLDLNNGAFEESDGLKRILKRNLESWEEEFQIQYPDPESVVDPSLRFAAVIRSAAEKTGKKVVILVDEYDKPLLNAIHKPELADIYRSQLKAFYSNLKTMDPFIEIAVLTGVARFSKVSIFSDLNNLNDITFDRRFAAICGITSEELDKYFVDGIRELGDFMGLSTKETREELRKRYDGYHFAEISPDIYNPFSLVNVFAKTELGDYWFASGTPTCLVRLIEKGCFPFREISPCRIDKRALESAGLLDNNPIPSFYQTGYLTIKDYDKDFKEYILDYPNEEVKYSFLEFLLNSYIPATDSLRKLSVQDFAREIRAGKPEEFMKRMESLIASIPYAERGAAEGYFQNAVYLLFTLLGLFARIEDRTSDGRIDLQVETHDYVYIFEFKVDASAREAMDQIREKKYWLRDAASHRQIFLIGANFNTKTRRLSDIIVEHP